MKGQVSTWARVLHERQQGACGIAHHRSQRDLDTVGLRADVQHDWLGFLRSFPPSTEAGKVAV